jgi:uncharacterized protein
MLRSLLIGGCLACLSWAGALAADPQSTAVTPPEAGGYYYVHVISYRDMPFRTVVRQKYDFSCGSAAIATLLKYHYGRDVEEATIFKAMYTIGDRNAIQHHGFSLADIQRYLKSIGIKSDGYRLPLERYAAARIPAIVMIRVGQYKHFVVIKGVENGRVLIGDPATGLHSYSVADFEKVWDGLVFIIHDEAHPNDHHNFDTEWAMLSHAPLENTSHLRPLVPDLADLDLVTMFAVRAPSAGDVGGVP